MVSVVARLFGSADRPPRWPWVYGGVGLGGVAAWLVGVSLAAEQGGLREVLGALLLGALLLGRQLVVSGDPGADAGRSPRWQTSAFVGGILILSAVLRLWDLAHYPLTFDRDNAQNGFVALSLWEELSRGGYVPLLTRWAIGNETFFFYIQGLFLKLFGVSIAVLRLPSALAGLATVFLLYILGRELWSARAGLFAALFCAVSPWHLDLSRSAKRAVLIPLFVALTIWLLLRALRHAPGRRAALWFALCGGALGLGLHTYELFRVVPFAAAVTVLWVRWRQRCWWQGPAEVGLMALPALLVASPILVEAVRHPEIYFHHATHASLLGQAWASASPGTLYENATRAVLYFLERMPLSGKAFDGLGGVPVALSPLFVLGLAGSLWAGSRPKSDQDSRGPRPCPARRALLWPVLGVMAGVLLVTEFNTAPRRYSGLLLPTFLLAGAAASSLAVALRGPLRGWLSRGASLALCALFCAGAPAAFGNLALYHENFSQARTEQALRWALDSVAAHSGRTVYLSPGLMDNHYLLRMVQKHPRIHRLHTSLPLPHAGLTEQVLFLSDGEPWREQLSTLARVTRTTIRLPLPELPSSDRPLQREAVSFTVFATRGADLAQARLSKDRINSSYSARLLVPRPGVYRFRFGKNVSGSLTLAGATHRLGGSAELRIGLAAGLVPLTYRPDKGKGPLLWQEDGQSAFSPLPAGLLWRLPRGRFAGARQVNNDGSVVDQESFSLLPTAATAEDDTTLLQDLAVMPDGAVVIVDTSLAQLTRWRPGQRQSDTLALTDAQGRPFAESYYDGPPEAVAYRLQLSSFRLAGSKRGFFLVDRHKASVSHFGLDGRFRGTVCGRATGDNGPRWLLDLAAGGGRIYLADAGRGAVLVCDPAEPTEEKVLLGQVTPTSVTLRDGLLVVADRRRHQLVLFDLEQGTVRRRLELDVVTEATTVSVAASGQLLVAQPELERVLLLDDHGQLIAVDHDPNFLTRAIPFYAPMAGHLVGSTGQTIMIGENQVWLANIGRLRPASSVDADPRPESRGQQP